MAQGFEALPWDELLGGVRFAYGGCLGGAADAACLEAMAHCWLRADRGAGDQGGDCGAGGGGGGGDDGGGGGESGLGCGCGCGGFGCFVSVAPLKSSQRSCAPRGG